MSHSIPAILIGGAASGVGKTSLTLAIVRLLGRRGMRVQTFKVGPDFLDPSYLAAASGRTCYNLDGWMSSREYVRDLFARAAGQADFAVIEGVMGLFDGAEPDGLDGSSAQIAAWLGVPVVLVVNAHGASRSLAAVVRGFADFEPSVRVAGVIANRCGSQRHVEGLRKSLAAAHCPPLVGAVPRDAMPTLQHRHLGLVTADADVLDEQTLDQLADAAEKYLDLETIVQLAHAEKAHGRLSVGSLPKSGSSENSEGGRSNNVSRAQERSRQSQGAHGTPSVGFERTGGRSHGTPSVGFERIGERSHGTPSVGFVRIGIARDRAFHFYYPDNLEALRAAGAELVEFSPLADARLPEGLGGVYFGGGYPEVHAADLAANGSMLADVRAFASGGGCVYAECGGLMYLGRSVKTLDGAVHELAGVLPVRTRMLERLRTLGYVEASLQADCLWGGQGDCLRGHEFHYSEIESDDLAAESWQRVYRLSRRNSGIPGNSGIPARDSSLGAGASEQPEPRPGMAALLEGFQKGNVLASYVHLHWAGRADLARRFVEHCGRQA